MSFANIVSLTNNADGSVKMAIWLIGKAYKLVL